MKRILIACVVVYFAIAAYGHVRADVLTTTTPASPEARSRGVLSVTTAVTDLKAKWWLLCEGKDPIGVVSWRDWGGSSIRFLLTDDTEIVYFSGNHCRIEKVKE